MSPIPPTNKYDVERERIRSVTKITLRALTIIGGIVAIVLAGLLGVHLTLL